MNVIYSGTVVPSAERLLRLGAPAKIANASEWDAIGAGFYGAAWIWQRHLVSCFDRSGAARSGARRCSIRWEMEAAGIQRRNFDARAGGVSGREADDRLLEWVRSCNRTGSRKHRQASSTLVRRILRKGQDEAEVQGQSASETQAAGHGWPASDSSGWQAVLQVVSFTLPPTRLGFAPLSFFVMHPQREASVPGLDIYSRADNKSSTVNVSERDSRRLAPWSNNGWVRMPKRPVVLVDLPDERRSSF